LQYGQRACAKAGSQARRNIGKEPRRLPNRKIMPRTFLAGLPARFEIGFPGWFLTSTVRIAVRRPQCASDCLRLTLFWIQRISAQRPTLKRGTGNGKKSGESTRGLGINLNGCMISLTTRTLPAQLDRQKECANASRAENGSGTR